MTMKLLVDTHIWIWFRVGSSRLLKSEIELILRHQSSDSLFLSAISIWETAMFQKSGRIVINEPIHQWVNRAINGFKVVPITTEIALESVALELNHKDPADRFIIATSRVMGLQILSHDQIIDKYYPKNGS